jgi:hypothetical protein
MQEIWHMEGDKMVGVESWNRVLGQQENLRLIGSAVQFLARVWE